jgi:hypothetical protein
MIVRVTAGRAIARRRAAALILAVLAAISVSGPFGAQRVSGAQMPDAKQMSGVPLPVGDLPVGTVTVRVVRGSIANVLPGQTVELSGGSSPLSARTNESGRAEFPGLEPGARVKAAVVVDGERIESQEFTVPPTGGVRIALVATDPAIERKADQNRALASGPVQPGLVALGSGTRFVFEMGDEALNAFAILEVVNTAGAPVQPPAPLVFALPDAAQGAAALQGSSPQGVVSGKRLTINGPFAPGSTFVQVGYVLPVTSSTITVEQKFPVALSQVSVLAQKGPGVQLESPQIAEHRDMPLQGETFIVAKGPALQAGDTLSLRFSGLPHQPLWPRNVALGLAALILAGGAWGTARAGRTSPELTERRRRLEAKRDRLFAELTDIEQQHRDRGIDPDHYATKRRELIEALERVYAEMDEEAAV